MTTRDRTAAAFCLLLAAMGAALVPIARTQSSYIPPIIPPIFTSQDINNSVAAFATAQSAYIAISTLVVKHDADLYGPTGVIANLRAANAINTGNILNVANSVTALQPHPLIPIDLSACVPVTPSTLNANQLPIANSVHGVLGGWKMQWISNPFRETISCPIAVPDAAYYSIIGAFISPTTGHTMHVEMPSGVNVSGEIAVPNTGNWISPFADAEAPLAVLLPAGSSTMLLNFEGGGFDFGGIALRRQ